MNIGEAYETDVVSLEKACDAYSKAAEWYRGEESHS
jgi:hypothetical protein